MIKLIVQSGPIRGRVFVPPPGVEVDIGRGEGCFVRIEGQDISRKHAVLVPHGFDYELRDLDSTNGTFVNGTQVETHRLRSGDTIRIGKIEISFVRDEADPWVGRTLGGCRILARIGRGGMGTVYRADQLAMERTVAIKILSEELGRDETFVASFVREARAMGKLSHANVVQVHNVGGQDGVYYLSMEYLEGGSVKGLIERDGQLPPRRAVDMALDATRALVWAEQHGIVHRDIKPGNLLLDATGRVKVADFGLASDVRQETALTERGRIVGSPPYMAPEQARGEPVDHRADIYALGSSLYAILAGRNPFLGKSVHEVLNAKLSGDPPPLWTLAPDSPRKLCEIVAKCMARQPEDRYEHAIELLRELGEVRASLGRSAVRTSGAPRGTESPPEKSGSTGGLASALRWVIVVGMVIGIGIGVFVALHRSGQGPRPTVSVDSTQGPQALAPASSRESASESDADGLTGPGETEEPVTGLEEDPPAEKAPPEAPAVKQALDRLLGERLPLLLIESRFQAALHELEEFLEAHPQKELEIQAALRHVRSAEALFEARTQALELQRAGRFDEAVAAIESRLDDLDDPHRLEARVAIEAIERDKRAASR